MRSEGGRRRKSRIKRDRSLQEAHLGQEDRVCGREGISSGRGCWREAPSWRPCKVRVLGWVRNLAVKYVFHFVFQTLENDVFHWNTMEYVEYVWNTRICIPIHPCIPVECGTLIGWLGGGRRGGCVRASQSEAG